MESSRPSADQLAELERLRRATVAESRRGRPWATPALALAIVAFFASYGVEHDIQRVVAPVIWTMFVLGWVRWLHDGNRARPRWFDQLGDDWRRHLPLWVGLLVVSNLIVAFGARVSWLLAGVLMALLATVPGTLSMLRARR